MSVSTASPVLNAVAGCLDGLAALIRSPRLADVLDSTAARTSAAIAALLIVLRYWSRKPKAKKGEKYYVTDFSMVARPVKEAGKYASDEYDVIIVGGGTAGCVLASRLSEDSSIRVLLVEAGQSAKNLLPARIPSAYGRFFKGPHDYSLYTEAQVNAGGNKRFWPRGKVLGGCSNMNAMIYHYGAPSDYDEWAHLQKGQAGFLHWTYQEFHPYFLKYERYNPSHQYPGVDPTLRGVRGLIDIGYHTHFSNPSLKFIEACKAAGVAHSHDVNTHQGTLGVTKNMTYVDSKGERVTTETAYLTEDVLARPNLKIATNATVTRILFSETSETIRAVGIEFVNKEGSRFQAKALKEVVLSAGAVHTPQILMLSGVGPSSHLSSLKIPVVADLPGVGSNLMDHLVVDLAYMDKSKSSLNYLRPANVAQTIWAIKALWQYKLTGKGPLSTNIAEAIAFIRSDDPSLFPPSGFPAESMPEDTTTGKAAPDLELFFTPVTFKEHGTERPPNWGHYGFMLHAVLLRPKSKGTIRLRSNNPADPPIIDPNYLADPNDVKTLVRGIRILDKIAHTEPLKSLIDPAGDNHPELHHNLGKSTDTELETLARNIAQTLYHPACSARMAPLADGGVVDPFLRVHGISNLRIADASVFPAIVSGHTAAPVIAIAEKAADLIKADISARSSK